MECSIMKNATVLFCIREWIIVQTHVVDFDLLIATFSDGLQVEYLIPHVSNTEPDHIYEVKRTQHTEKCLILSNECKEAVLTYKLRTEKKQHYPTL